MSLDTSFFTILLKNSSSLLESWFSGKDKGRAARIGTSQNLLIPLYFADLLHWALVVLRIRQGTVTILDYVPDIRFQTRAAELLRVWAEDANKKVRFSRRWPKNGH